jgi:hypothetical protein
MTKRSSSYNVPCSNRAQVEYTYRVEARLTTEERARDRFMLKGIKGNMWPLLFE